MPHDHFIAQTYLRNFGDSTHGGMLHGYRKSDGAQFPCWPKDVCREWDGDLNPVWLAGREDLLGQFRKIFEPIWRVAAETLLLGSFSAQDKLAIAGYVANLMNCTPAWRRVAVQVYNDHAIAYLSFAKRMKEKHGGDPTLPVDGIAMLEAGELELEYDPDYIKAVVTRRLLDTAWLMYNQDWVVLANSTAHPFVTSDNPVAIIGASELGKPLTRFVPITPKLGIQIIMSRRKLPKLDVTLPPLGHVAQRSIGGPEAKRLNKMVARSAEELVFSSVRSAGISALVRNAARFRMEVDFVEFPANEPDAVYQGSILAVQESKQAHHP